MNFNREEISRMIGPQGRFLSHHRPFLGLSPFPFPFNQSQEPVPK